MKNGLIAPQFGFLAMQFAEERPDAPPSPSEVFTSSPAAPSVVITTLKKRRLVDLTTVPRDASTTAGMPKDSALPGSGDPARESKVFRWPSSPAAASEPSAASAAPEQTSHAVATPLGALAGTQRRRGRRNPLTAPVLVRHEVFEPRRVEQPLACPVLELGTAPADGDDYASVNRALGELRAKVATLARASKGIFELGRRKA